MRELIAGTTVVSDIDTINWDDLFGLTLHDCILSKTKSLEAS